MMLYDPMTENVHILNPSSRFLWEHLDGHHELEDIERKMQLHFTIPESINLEIFLKFK
ncbi:MAG: PqqD family peptide modification chaperone [Chlamydiae bacterium]|nr:PqqD family peptide modification chaperone [Chlamydiota bacterium]MBI3276614.1 PqqD family peptide modification chaperone [Chlamydiota bacterium]